MRYVSRDEASDGTIDQQDRLLTGDFGRLDREGYLYLAGRKSDMIKSAGERIFPAEIEDIIGTHPQVLECAVLGLADPLFGECVVAGIVKDSGSGVTAEEVRKLCLQFLPFVVCPGKSGLLKTFRGLLRERSTGQNWRFPWNPFVIRVRIETPGVKQVSQDLRSFIEAVRREYPGEIVDVHREVKPQHETAAILAKLENGYRSPLLFFHHLAGCDFPLVSNVCGSLNRLGLALGCRPSEISGVTRRPAIPLIKPRLTTQAPVQETVVEGDQLDLNILPHLVYHEQDTPHPYITAAIVVARDPDSGESNLSYHRLMISGRNTTAIYMEPANTCTRFTKSMKERISPCL